MGKQAEIGYALGLSCSQKKKCIFPQNKIRENRFQPGEPEQYSVNNFFTVK